MVEDGEARRFDAGRRRPVAAPALTGARRRREVPGGNRKVAVGTLPDWVSPDGLDPIAVSSAYNGVTGSRIREARNIMNEIAGIQL
jgi:hypothetical protein